MLTTEQHNAEDNAYIPVSGGHLVLPCAFIARQKDTAHETKIKSALTQTLTALSLAKQALEGASGSRFPPQYFGCGGVLRITKLNGTTYSDIVPTNKTRKSSETSNRTYRTFAAVNVREHGNRAATLTKPWPP
jgi:hypothetical protein